MAVVTAQTAMNVHDVLITFGTHFSEVDALQKINLQWFACPIITNASRFSCSNVLCPPDDAILKVELTKVIVVIVVVLALFASIASIISGVKVYQGQFEQSIFNEAVKFQEMWLVSSAVCDVLITATMIFLNVIEHRLSKTERMVFRLIRQLIEAGFITVADLCVFLSFPSHAYHVAICNSFPDLYSVTLLILLNGRPHASGSTSNTKVGLSWNVVPGTLDISHITTIPQSSDEYLPDSIHDVGVKDIARAV
ncbi:hypothetical protein D9757_012270 [Collybiopsis confluens]|uniref:DUF6534 domain-containing protein n=1 Tax=Collybiopsis confluens TaxID=2823264 RepID=A0A8H5G5Q7_9AGAR|nr:hypothetical protein D9757_012270 [Collybiopsis confluens]